VRPLLAFVHVPKSGGSTVLSMLRSNFGIAHVTAPVLYPGLDGPTNVPVYGRSEWEFIHDLCPQMQAISGHNIQLWSSPCVDVQWFTVLREPVARVASHYQYVFERGITKQTPQYWIPENVNMACRMLSRAGTAQAAHRMIIRTGCYVAMLNKLDVSIQVFKDGCWPDLNTAALRVNVAKDNSIADWLKTDFRELIEWYNAEDILLYNTYNRVMPDLAVVSNDKFNWPNYYAERAYDRCVLTPVALTLPMHHRGIKRDVRAILRTKKFGGGR